MAKLDHNLDAYRLAAAALERLRTMLRRHLEAKHGPTWETDGLPEDPRDYLAQRRDREASVKWNSSSGLDLLDFAGFVNLFEILSTHKTLLEGFSRLVPEPQALRMRFLELDTVLNRIAYARPVSESDTELLLGFNERLRTLANDLAVSPTATPDSEPVAQVVAATATTPKQPLAEAPPPAEEKPAPREVPNAPRHEPAPTPPPAEVRSSAHVRVRVTDSTKDAHPRGAGTAAQSAVSAGVPPSSGKSPEAPTVTKDFELALRRGDDSVILGALYHEITSIAEKIWGDATAARCPVWEAVCESPWYENRFSALRLRIVSDFYDLLRSVQERLAAGSSRNELHEFLKDRNFAQILMDLREFFRPLASGRHRARG